MTLSDRHPLSTASARPDTANPPEPTPPDPSGLLTAALAAGLSDKAIRLAVGAALTLPRGRFLPLGRYASAAGLSHAAAAQVVGELVRAGLVSSRRMRGIVGGKKRDVTLYALAVRP